MKIAVAGLWHLGCVTAACLAKFGHQVIGFDTDEKIISGLKNGKAPLYEPGLNELIISGQNNQNLSFTIEKDALIDADVFWITYDTPINEEDHADVAYVKNVTIQLFPLIKEGASVIISSQLPVGSIRDIQERYEAYPRKKTVYFACMPENLRLGNAIQIFMQPDRVIVGIASNVIKPVIEKILAGIKDKIIWMSIESAEVSKHAINAFLAASVTFINEIAALCENVGAKASDVEIALKSEQRIGQKAYLRPGTAFAGGTLARDINYLISLGKKYNIRTPLFLGILESNLLHKQWLQRKISNTQKSLRGKKIAVLGLSYKPGTDTLRRSTSVETCVWLAEQGAKINAYDQSVVQLPDELAQFITLHKNIGHMIVDADVVIVATACSEMQGLTPQHFSSQTSIYDAAGYLKNIFCHHKQLNYYTVGEA